MRGPWPKEVNFWEKIWNELARKKSFCSKTCFRFSRKGEDLLKVHETKPSSSDDSITPYNGTLTFFLYIVKQIYCCSCISEGKSILSYIHKGTASKDRDVIILNCLPLVRLHLECCIQFWSPQKTDWRQSKGRLGRWSKGWRACPVRKDWRSLVLSPWRRLRGDLIIVFHYLQRDYKEDGVSVFISSHTEKTRGNGYKFHW